MGVLTVTNPMTGEVLDKLTLSTHEEVSAMVEAAVAAQESWAATPVYERAKYLYRFADAMEQEEEVISRLSSIDMAKPIAQSRIETADGIKLLRAAAERAKHLYGDVLSDSGPGFEGDLVFTKREPLGTIACIIPFNFPIELTFQKIAPALAMGNTVLVKAPSSNPLAVLSLDKYAKAAGFPEGVVQFFVSERDVVNECVLANPKVDAVSLTGSTAAGKKIVEAGADTLKRTFLELGGNDALIVFEDADVDRAVEEMVTSRLENNGQVCCSSKRFIVQRKIYNSVASKLLEKLSSLKRGDALEEDAVVTALVSEQAAKAVEEQIAHTIEQGARLLYGGTRDGARIEPTVLLDVTPEMDIASNMEIFGPVFPLIPFDTEEEGISIANNSIYGLSSGLMTKDMNRAFRVASKLKAGGAVVNGSGGYRHLDQPFGGFKQSGLGREGISISLEEFSHIKVYVVKGAFN
ncbi:MAG: aldehyde dehydrogenase family protein [Eubacteriales bacterium]|nr:aldehyde dehydrogenase family protein [Eubacteriales bacterium]